MDEAQTSRSTRTSVTVTRSRQVKPQAGRNKVQRWPYILLSLVLGALLWADIDMKRMQDSELVVELGLQQILPADWKATQLSTDKVTVSIRGTRQATSTIREDNLSIVPNISREAFESDVFEGRLGIAPTQVRGLPPGVQALSVKPDIIFMRLDKVATRYLPVKPGEVTGEPAPGFMVSKIGRPEPPDLPITGPKSLLDSLTPEDAIETPPLNVDGKKGTVREWLAPLPFNKNGIAIDVDGMVEVRVELLETPVIKTLEQPIGVKALIDAPFERHSDLTLSPPSVTVTVSGTKSAVESLSPNEIVVYVDIRERLPATPGEFNMKCRYIAPPRIQVVKIEPDTVKWITKDTAHNPRPAAAGQETQTEN